MRILVVEDEDDIADEIERRIHSDIHNIERLDRAIGQSDASSLIARNTYDAALIDLRIPSAPRHGDASLEFGKAVEAEIARLQPGALRLFVTAHSADQVVDQLSSGEVDEFFIVGERYQIVRYFRKDADDIRKCMNILARHEGELRRLDSASLENVGSLSLDSRRAVAMSLALLGGTSGWIDHPGGLSGNTTALLNCFDDNGVSVGRCFIKVGTPHEMDYEYRGYEAVRFLWPSTALPNLAYRLTFGIGTNHAVVFTHANATENFFELVQRDPDAAVTFVDSLQPIIGPRGATTEHHNIGELRRSFTSDDEISQHMGDLRARGLLEVEASSVSLSTFIQHGDLHGANVLVNPNGDPLIIDFGWTGPHAGPFDPVLLELSLLFHPASGLQSQISVAQCGQWLSGNYADGTSFAPVTRACRSLATASGHSEEALAAIGWVQALRHLKFPHTSKERALAIAESCAQRLLNG